MSSTEDSVQALVKRLEFEGNSRSVIRSFPKEVRKDLGNSLRRLQKGLEPLHWRPMKSIGVGVGEIKDMDDRAWYRVIYYTKIKDAIYVLHAFEKESAKTEKRDLRTAGQRLAALKARLRRGEMLS